LPYSQDTFTKCVGKNFFFLVTTLPVGTTVGGLCNGTAGSDNDTLLYPRGIAIINNGTTLAVADSGNARVQAFSLFQNKNAGSMLMTVPGSANYSSYVIAYNNSLYVSIPPGPMLRIWPSNSTIPPLSHFSAVCSSQYLYTPMGIVVDSHGSIYVANQGCHSITHWTGSSSSNIAGIPDSLGSSDQILSYSSGIHIDQQRKSLYVADSLNNRIQKFNLTENSTGITVAGGNGPGPAANPLDVYVSQLNGVIYIMDCDNNRVQR
jgi:hypothetical protein